MQLRHYEIVFLVHPDQSEQVPGMIDRYVTLVTEQGGHLHRKEDIGRLALAYAIKTTNKTVNKAHYALLNIECSQATIKELDRALGLNDAVIRFLIEKKTAAETGPSALMTAKENKEDQYNQQQ
jgi:small subunit ribosomal protein S6